MDELFMKRALELAKKGQGSVNPNPMVGAVIIKDNKIIAEGYHEIYGGLHAEINAINNAKEDLKGATIYVTLEPCSHYGKTPPCVDKIIEMKFNRVVIGMVDPNPIVSGKGVEKLQEAGIEVIVGVLEKECKKLNEIFIKYITTKEPFVVLKSGMSLDGKISTSKGESKWITSEESRRDVHKLRSDLMAIMVGVNTVIEDNPQLTCRLEDRKNPIRIVVDSNLRIPLDSKVLQNQESAKTIIVTTKNAQKEKKLELEKLSIDVIEVKDINGKVSLKELSKAIGQLKIDSILLEGGATLNDSALREGIVDKVKIYIAPKIIGGQLSKTPVGGSGIDKLSDAYKLKDLIMKSIGEDILIEGYLEGGNA